jgi:hypothetical protein
VLLVMFTLLTVPMSNLQPVSNEREVKNERMNEEYSEGEKWD